MKFWKSVLAAASGVVLMLGGCGPREEQQVTVSQPPQKVIEKTTTIKPVPQNKTVIVKPAPAPKTTTKTNVNVTVVPAKTPVPLPAPAPDATPQATPKISTIPTPNPAPRMASTPRPTPKPATTPRPTPIAAKSGPLVVRAEIVSASKVPDPRKVAYKDSIVFFKYKVLSVQSGEYDEKEILVAHWGMKNKILQPAARYRVGDVQTIQVEPLDNHAELEKLQRNDDTGEFSLDPYWARPAGY